MLGSSDAGALELYHLPIVPFNEVLAASRFRDAFFSFRPGLVDQNSIFSKIFVTDIAVDITPSPSAEAAPKFVDKTWSILSVGSPAYNPISRHIEQTFSSCAHFDIVPELPGSRFHGEASVVYDNVRVKNDVGFHYGFAQRIVTRGRGGREVGRTLFYVAGLNEYGTTGALDYLMENWRRLYNEYGADKSFVVMLKFEAGRDRGMLLFDQEFT